MYTIEHSILFVFFGVKPQLLCWKGPPPNQQLCTSDDQEVNSRLLVLRQQINGSQDKRQSSLLLPQTGS